MSPLPNATSKTSPHRRNSGAGASRRTPAQPNGSHWPAFLAGIVVGLAASWLAPKLLEVKLSPTPAVAPDTAPDESDSADPSFNFPQLFRDNEIVVPEGPAVGAEPSDNAAPVDYYIQVGSFRASDDAQALRVQLLLLNLDASVEPIKTANGLWHRVVVGPFANSRSAEQARTKLHENNIRTLVLKRPR